VIYKPINASVKIFGRIIVLFPNVVEPYNVLGMGTCAKASDGTYKCTYTAPPYKPPDCSGPKGMETYALGKTGKENQMELLSFLHKQMQNHPSYVKGV
jgi:hypothetical protein